MAFTFRVAALWFDRNSLLFSVGGLDAPHYLASARLLPAGQWPAPEAFFWAPGYSGFLGLLSLVSDSTVWFKLVQVVLGTLSCGLVALLAWRTFGDTTMMLVALAIAGVYGPLVFYDIQISPASIDVFLSLALTCLLLEANRREHIGWWALAGLAAAASAITRGGVCLFVPCLVAWIAWSKRSAPGQALRECIVLVAPLVIAIALVASHNRRFDLEGTPPLSDREAPASAVLISSNLGINFLLGNHPELYKTNDVMHPLCFVVYRMTLSEPRYHGKMSSSSQSAFLVGKALAWMRGHLAEWSLLMVRKVHELLQGHEISRDQNIYASRADNRAIAALMWQGPVDLPSGVLIPLILLGAAMATATRQHSAIVLLFLATQVVFVLAFFIATRYRLALCAAAIPYAAYGIVSLQRRLLVSPRSALPWVVLLAGFMVLCNSNKLHAFEGRVPFEHSHLADALASFGMRDRAFESLRAALRLDPMYGPAHFQLAGYYREQGELAMAEGHYLAGLRAAPMAYPARHEYAELLLALGRAYDATRELKRVWMDVPGAEIRARLCHAMSLAGLSEPLTQADRCETEPRLEGKATP